MSEDLCEMCNHPIGNTYPSRLTPWVEHADRSICAKNIRADERERYRADLREQVEALERSEVGEWEWVILEDVLKPTEGGEMSEIEGIPYVAIGHGEKAPWEDLPLTCPTCGEGPLPLLDSVPPGLSYIEHCGGVWVRGPLRLKI